MFIRTCYGPLKSKAQHNSGLFLSCRLNTSARKNVVVVIVATASFFSSLNADKLTDHLYSKRKTNIPISKVVH